MSSDHVLVTCSPFLQSIVRAVSAVGKKQPISTGGDGDCLSLPIVSLWLPCRVQDFDLNVSAGSSGENRRVGRYRDSLDDSFAGFSSV